MTRRTTSPSGPWAISVRTKKQHILKVVPRKEGESHKACYQRAKEAVKNLRRKYADREDVVVELISRRIATPPPDDLQLKRNQLWCPYCRKPRLFKTGQTVEIDGVVYQSSDQRCVICGMSVNDYYVKTYNRLWPAEIKGK